MDQQPLAIVTGGARRLGKHFALTLAKRGYAILLHYHTNSAEAEITANEIQVLGVPAYLVQADLTDDNGLTRVISTLDSLPHRLNILINSASIMKRKDIHAMSGDDWDATFALNLRAPFLLAQQAAKRMIDKGLIINITDAGVQKLWTGYPAYLVSKSSLETLTRLQAKAYAPGIRVNAIAPGLVLPSLNISGAEWEKLVQRSPQKRPVSLEEITSALLYLVDNKSVTGQTIVLDGGNSLF
jgi:pteridine reductase